MTNLINRINFNTFHLKLTTDLNYYENQIFKALSEGKNIVVPTMSAVYANQLQTTTSEKFPGLNIKIYTSTCGGEEKKKLRGVDNEWKDANVLIYSPTISAGVSFDKQHFHKIFGVICSKSCSERDYHQMLRRVRKIEDDTILILNYSNLRLPADVLYTSYSDMREYCMKVKDCNLRAKYTDVGDETIIIYEVDGFDESYFYNRAEAANSDDNTFLTAFLSRAHQKGYTYELLQNQDEENQMRINTEHRENCKIEELLSAPDITKEEADILKEKTNRREDTKADK